MNVRYWDRGGCGPPRSGFFQVPRPADGPPFPILSRYVPLLSGLWGPRGVGPQRWSKSVLKGVLLPWMHACMVLGWVVVVGLLAARLVSLYPVSEGLSSDHPGPVAYGWSY